MWKADTYTTERLLRIQMTYNVGDKLECIIPVNAQCLNMTNPNFYIEKGDEYIITYKDNLSGKTTFYWYEMTPIEENDITLIALDVYPEHMILQECFEKK